MPTPVTRQKIIDAAVRSFNRDGIANIRLQQIADEAFVSVGNMTYHYRNKEAIVAAIWEQLVQMQRDLLAEFRVLPLFEDIDRLLISTFDLQQEYRFFYIDTLEVMRAYPEIQAAHRQHIQWQILQMELAITFNQSRGAFLPDEHSVQSGQLARQFWLNTDLWMYRQCVLGNDISDFQSFRSSIWAMFLPYLSDTGKREFEQLGAYLEKNI